MNQEGLLTSHMRPRKCPKYRALDQITRTLLWYIRTLCANNINIIPSYIPRNHPNGVCTFVAQKYVLFFFKVDKTNDIF